MNCIKKISLRNENCLFAFFHRCSIDTAKSQYWRIDTEDSRQEEEGPSPHLNSKEFAEGARKR